jgi:hypothetical protein
MAARAIVGVGGAPDGPDAPSAARRQALLEIVEQIRVRIAGDTTLRARVDGTGESWNVDEHIRTRASAEIEGADVVDTCHEKGTTYVLAALDRERFAVRAGERIERMKAELASLESKARASDATGFPLDAAALWFEAAAVSSRIEDLAALVEVIGQRQVPSRWTDARTLRRQGLATAGKAVVRVEVDAPAEAEPLRNAAVVCLGRAGMPVAGKADNADAVFSLKVTLENAGRVDGDLIVVRGTLNATMLRKHSATVSAAADGSAKGAGDSEAAARRDTMHVLSSRKVPEVIDRLLRSGGWVLPSCSDKETAAPSPGSTSP